MIPNVIVIIISQKGDIMGINLKRSSAVISAVIFAVSAFSPLSAAASETETEAEGEVTTVQVGTMGTYSPYSYYDDDDNLTGYDIEVVRKVEETDPTLHFEFTTGAWESLYPGLDSDKYQMLANQIVANDNTREKYYVTENSYYTSVSQIITGADRDDISSLEDLEGKTVGLTVGDNFFNSAVENYNEEHDDAINIQYYQEDITTILQDIENGRIDATINDPAVAVSKAALQGLEVKPVGDRLAEAAVVFVFKQDDVGAELRDRIDAALSELKENGELSELSIEWFGEDYTS